MGIAIFAAAPSKLKRIVRSTKYPIPTVLQLTCDMPRHGLFEAPCVSFSGPGGFAVHYSAAMRAGWKDSFYQSKRVFLCPGCSGK